MATKRVLVSGATGQQGGAVVDALLSGEYGEYDVSGMTRSAESDAAAALAARGVHVVEADLNDRASLDAAVEEMEYVFLVTTFFEDGPEAEADHGRRMIDACVDAGVDYVVYSSVASADTAPLEHFASKARVEESLVDSGLDWTIVRPVYFMQNFTWLAASIRDGELAVPLAEDVSLGVVDVGDIGRTVATAFADPASWRGETVEIAGDELTLEGFAAAFSAALDRDVRAVHLDVEAYRAEGGDEMADMYRWFNEGGYDIDVDALSERTGIDYVTFPEYLDAHWASRSAPASA
ncbi:NmrA/HSCARG family protein [Salinigranum salinum]|uniref:NmrA/HSCARG family protein n=1 Tax=Salinigranum salinum TaxID=1364937 RepID=UPI001260C387|nr:NmrA/HSCARG family protein [Salinigranum salinum]